MATASTASTSIWDSINSTVSSAFNTASLAVAQITPLAVSVAQTKVQLAQLKVQASQPVQVQDLNTNIFGEAVYTGNGQTQQKSGFDTTTLIIGGLGLLALIMLRRGGA